MELQRKHTCTILYTSLNREHSPVGTSRHNLYCARIEVMSLVVLNYDDLMSDKDLSEEILQAYGEGSVGALAVRGIPNWATLRSNALPLAHSLASLSEEKKNSLEDESSMYNAGWSFGKEKMGDKPDFAKASFYFNPLIDNPSPELRQQYPWALPANIWPEESDIPNFKMSCCEIGVVMKEVASALARHIDRVLSDRVPGYESGLFYGAMRDTIKAKSRMLYYYPIPEDKVGGPQTDNWIAWHNDSGFLTCLAGDIFVEHETGRIIENPEPESAGLWIADRYVLNCAMLNYCLTFRMRSVRATSKRLPSLPIAWAFRLESVCRSCQAAFWLPRRTVSGAVRALRALPGRRCHASSIPTSPSHWPCPEAAPGRMCSDTLWLIASRHLQTGGPQTEWHSLISWETHSRRTTNGLLQRSRSREPPGSC
jgi:isopenicillin N synthase-like dioxygenase